MKIYIGHSSNFDFKNELYKPIKESTLYTEHTVIFPHENTEEVFNSKEVVKNCDLMIAEVSYPSTGLGIEMGWANVYGCLVVGIYREGSQVSKSLGEVCSRLIEYSDEGDMINDIKNFLS